ncbi:MAG: ATP-binding protein [Bacteroidota bacterium]
MKKLIIDSSLTQMHKVEEFVEMISDIYNINTNYYSTILMALDEATRNAIEHGNNFDKAKKVTIQFKASKGELVFQVKDEGRGFRMDAVKDPLSLSADMYNSAGKGVFLMKQLSDGIGQNEEGNEVSLHFKISSINNDLAVHRSQALKTYFQNQTEIVKTSI